MTDDLAAVAVDAVTDAGNYLADRFDGGLDADYTATDVKTVADEEAERRILETLRARYPDHAITAEESGHHPGDGDYRWVVDALDGTNNFAAGIPTFGSVATVVDDAGPVATAVHVPVLDDRYVATRDGGVTYSGTRVTVADGDGVPTSHATVGMIIGPDVIYGDELGRRYDAVVDAVDPLCKRTIQTWAPVVYWGLLARGRLDGFVCFHPAEREQVAGELLAREAGCVERGDGPLTVFARDEETAELLWAAASDAVDDE